MSDSKDETSNRRRRPSSLQVVAAELPSMEALLDACVARANELDVGEWDHAEHVAAQEDAERQDADELRWQTVEAQLHEREAREVALRQQLDALSGQVAEAEARVVSGSDEAIELQAQLDQAEQRALSGEQRLAALRAVPDDRVQIAEARAAKAIAAAHAVVAGLSISPDELAAIESGLPRASVRARRRPWLATGAAFVGGIGLMFAVARLVPSVDRRVVAQPIAAPSVPAPSVPAPRPAPRPAPTVTPIEPEVATPIAQSPPSVARTASSTKTRPRHNAAPVLVDPFHGTAPTKTTKTNDSLVDPFKEAP